MKKITFLIILSLLLVGCMSNNDDNKIVDKIEVMATVLEVDLDNNVILVKGLKDNNPLGDKSLINIKDTIVSKLDKPASVQDILVNDEVFLEVGTIAESYPTQTKAFKLNITKVYVDNKDAETDDDKEKDKEPIKQEEKMDIKLYFIVFDDTDAYLVEEIFTVEKVRGIAKLSLETLRDLSPNTKAATNPINKETKINDIYIKDKIIYVDFSKEISNKPFGSTGEVLQVMAIVNTLTQFESVDGVIFTIDGKEDIEAWLSHIGNVDKPFTQDLSLVKDK